MNKRSPAGSLVRRILTVAILLLVIPLFIQSFILYKREYHHIEDYYFHFATLLFFVGVIGGGAVYLFTRRIGRPLKELCETMERVSAGDAHARYSPDRMGFEINALGNQFNATLDALLLHTQATEELRIGHEIQAGLLSSHIPELAGVDLAASYLPAKEVSGDFYDLFRLDNGKLLIAICDIAGKGISACLFSLGLRSILRSLASVTNDLSEFIRKVNDLYLIDAHASSMFATLWLGIYDPATHRLDYCSQGHPPALLRREGKLQELWTGGIALGAQKIDVIPTKHITLMKGDLLLLYTDGVIEAHNQKDQLFGKERLKESLLGQGTSQQIGDQLIEKVSRFSRGAVQHDDITLVVLQIPDR